MSKKEFANKLLNGVSIGIVVGLIPAAILGEVFKGLLSTTNLPIFQTLLNVVNIAQSSVPVIIGCVVAFMFSMSAIETATMGATLLVGSGVVKLTENGAMLKGVGDLINIILVSFVAVIVIKALQGKLGSLTMIVLPVVVITFVGAFGVFTLPYVAKISQFIGEMIKHFTTLQPLLMSVLISVSFAIIIISPMSTVGIALLIGLEGLASGAANIGIATCAMTLVVGSLQINKLGVSLALFLGSMKLFIPNWLKYPIINIPIILNGIVGGFIAYFFNIQGTAQSAGFGFSGLVGPINAYKYMEGSFLSKVIILFIAYFVLTALFAYIIDFILVKVVKLYSREIFRFGE